MLPLLIADSGGTKTDWCFVDSSNTKRFFTTESYHPVNWSSDFEFRVNDFWKNYPECKKAKVYIFCAGCLHDEKSKALTEIFKRTGFSNVAVKSDLHGAALSLYGKEDGNCAILGTGSVFFEWKNQKVSGIKGGKGHLEGDEGSGFYFGKLVYAAFKNGKLSGEQLSIFKKEIDIEVIDAAIVDNTTKRTFSRIAQQLGQYSEIFRDWHQLNIDLFFDAICRGKAKMNLSVVGGYFSANSTIFIPHLKQKEVKVERFSARPIDSLVDYFVRFGE